MKLILSNIYKFIACLWLSVLCGSQLVWAERCEPQIGNEYEKIFCDLKRSGKGAALPTIYQFRENPPLTQALLLKKPAERAGITVKIPERNDQETLRRQEELLTTEIVPERPRALDRAVTTVAIVQQAAPIVVPVQANAPVEVVQIKPVVEQEKKVIPNLTESALTETGMEGCTLQNLVLQCASNRYQLIGNRTNQQLSGAALTEENKLGLPVYNGAPDDATALEEYLTRSYERYLTGMIEIGLGASTMSYGKFVNLHKYITEQHLDFAGRFETMYKFLKKDKQAIGVSTKLAIAEGLPLQSCSTIGNFIACDYQKSNYVFVKAD